MQSPKLSSGKVLNSRFKDISAEITEISCESNKKETEHLTAVQLLLESIVCTSKETADKLSLQKNGQYYLCMFEKLRVDMKKVCNAIMAAQLPKMKSKVLDLTDAGPGVSKNEYSCVSNKRAGTFI